MTVKGDLEIIYIQFTCLHLQNLLRGATYLPPSQMKPGFKYTMYMYLPWDNRFICVHVHVPCQLGCLGRSVGRASVWSTECRGFESHLRQFSFFIFPLPQVSFFLSFYISCNIMYMYITCISVHVHVFLFIVTCMQYQWLEILMYK